MDELRQKLITNAAKIAECRKKCLEAKEVVMEAKEDLASSIAALYNGKQVEGSNDKARDACIRAKTSHERITTESNEAIERAEMLGLELALDERRLLESLLKIEEIKR